MSLSQPELACESVLRALKVSRLTFSSQETPFSCYVTIRKKFAQNYKDEMFSDTLPVIEDLKSTTTCEKFETLITENNSLMLKLEEALKENEDLKKNESKVKLDVVEEKRIICENSNLKLSIEKVKQEKKMLESELESAEKESKILMKTIKMNEKKIYDLEKENRKTKEDLQHEKKETAKLNAQINKEKKNSEKRSKKQEKKEFLKTLTADYNPNKFPCNKCSELLDAEDKLKNHMLNNHTRSISTQTDLKIFVERKTQVNDSEIKINKNTEVSADVKKEFEKYSCFYCACNIVSKDKLKEHIG